MPQTYAETGNTPPRGQGPNDLDPASYSKEFVPGREPSAASSALKATIETIAGGAPGRPNPRRFTLGLGSKPAGFATRRKHPPLGPARPAREAQQMMDQREAMQQPGRMPGSAPASPAPTPPPGAASGGAQEALRDQLIFHENLRRLGGTTGGRFTDADIARMQSLAPRLGDTQEQGQSKRDLLRRSRQLSRPADSSDTRLPLQPEGALSGEMPGGFHAAEGLAGRPPRLPDIGPADSLRTLADIRRIQNQRPGVKRRSRP